MASNMEVNKDEALRCQEIADGYFREKKYDLALKFFNKSKKLYNCEEIRQKIQIAIEAEREGSNPPRTTNESQSKHNTSFSRSDSTDSSSSNSENTNENTTKRRNKSENENHSANTPPNYTQEQLEAVRKIKKCKDYYEILNITKETANEMTIKKQYRKLALQFHPDKNLAPGAEEAFKMIGQAYATLSDSKKRETYDMLGHEAATNHARGYSGSPHQGGFYQEDISPDEIFEMFFGIPSRQGNARRRYSYTTFDPFAEIQRRGRQNNSTQENPSLVAYLFQLLPFLFLFLYVISMFQSHTFEPPFMLDPNAQYPDARTYRNVKYYVKKDFAETYSKDSHGLKEVERNVLQSYIQRLGNKCMYERQQKENLAYNLRWGFRNNDLQNKYDNFKMPNCEKYEKEVAKGL